MKNDFIRVVVTDWEHYNPKHKKNDSWFRMQNDFGSDHKIRSLPLAARYLYILILCQASVQSRYDPTMSRVRLRYDLSTSTARLQQYLDDLFLLGLLQPVDIINDTTAKKSLQTNERTYVRTNNEKKIENNQVKENNKAPSREITSIWLSALNVMGIQRTKPSMTEAQLLDALIKQHGKEDLITSIIGMCYDKKTDNYNPKDWVGIKLLQNNFERYLNLGCKNKERFLKENIKHLTESSYKSILETSEVQNAN